MVFNNSKRGQAAIEFLMTYGWMLLVVLIVGALIFSFVDFGNLLPNKVELNNNVMAAGAESYASIGTAAATNSHVVVTFTYQGSQRVTISPDDASSKIESELDGDCDLIWLKNADTDEATDVGTGVSVLDPLVPGVFTGIVFSTDITFISGQIGVAIYDCSAAGLPAPYNTGNGFRENDVLEGKITLTLRNAKTDVPVPSSGSIRLAIIS
ncbi:MAG: hypothetical protein PF569_06065 [Candidatus Woesearchaeota archaeon]|jgi:hypothetical protein|nr:hypothetical protein [Candidatus Woesearchaeota archaeon]